MEGKNRNGLFQAIDSFGIRRRNEFYLMGNLIEGEAQENWFVKVPLNKSISITFRISQIEDVDFSNHGGKYKLLVIKNDDDEKPLIS